MKICFLLGDITKNGGIGRVTSILSNHMASDPDMLVNILSFFDTGRDNFYTIKDCITQDNLYASSINMKKALLTAGHLKLRRYLTKNNIDILIAAGAIYFPISILACRNIRTKCICWEHSNLRNNDVFFKRFCRSFAAHNADWIVVLTKKDLDSYKNKFNIKKISQIYNPIDPLINNYEHRYKSDAHRIISVGRLCYAKNYELLIQIAEEIFETPDANDWEWHIYGEGELREKLESMIHDKNLEDKVILKGQSRDIYSKYSEYAFLVMTSRYEGFPMVLTEGLACGLPLIGFDIYTGPSEIIENEHNGFLINKDDKKEMIDKIKLLIKNPNLCVDMSKHAKECALKFDVEYIGEEWINLFCKIIRNDKKEGTG